MTKSNECIIESENPNDHHGGLFWIASMIQCLGCKHMFKDKSWEVLRLCKE